MPEMTPGMTPDPMLDKLARFTPSAAAVDQAALLFAVGRASARTPWGWKIVAAGLLLANLGWLSLLTFHSDRVTVPGDTLKTDPVPTPEPSNAPEKPRPPYGEEPWNCRSLIFLDDPEQLPRSELLREPVPTVEPLTPRSVNRGEID